MCLVVFAWKAHPEYRLILAANRDEFHERPAQEMHWWPDQPDIIAGRDLRAGGTWLAAARGGHFATVTNYREPDGPRGNLRSRGELVSNFVGGDISPVQFNAAIEAERYAGFSLLTADSSELCYVSNRGDKPASLASGVYGLSNASLDTPWPKLVRARDGLSALVSNAAVNESELLRLMEDRQTATAAEVGNDSLPFELARALSAPFILTPDYGTRCISILLWGYDEKILLTEKRFDASGVASGESRFSFRTA
jgi:uncharacterized protein with NRDE domain